MIYFVTDGTAIKIGYSIDGQVGRRIGKLQTGNPRRLRLLATCHGSKKAEKRLHRQFQTSALRGEWFRRSKDLLGFVSRLRLLEK